jgi:hypothetical protein
MSALTASGIVFAFAIGATLLGMFLRTRIPAHPLNRESWDLVTMVLAVLGTLTALVLGLMIDSSKKFVRKQDRPVETCRRKDCSARSYSRGIWIGNQRNTELMAPARRSADSRDLDRYGYLPKDLEETLSRGRGIETIQQQILNLAPNDDAQRWFKATALDISNDIAQTRWMAVVNTDRSILLPFLAVLTFWTAAIFVIFGIFAPRNVSMFSTLAICALSIAGAIFLIVEMDQPFGGFVRVPSAPIEAVLNQLNKP